MNHLHVHCMVIPWERGYMQGGLHVLEVGVAQHSCGGCG